MLTAESITDAQIRELRDRADGDLLVLAYCAAALFIAPRKSAYRTQRRSEARARCAEILNEET